MPSTIKLHRRVEKLDNETSSDEDDLDIIRSATKEVDLMSYLDDKAEPYTSGTDQSDPSTKRERDKMPEGKRLTWSDDEEPDEVYQEWKKRKITQRKQVAARTRKAKAAASGNTIVGRKPKTGIKLRDDKATRAKAHDGMAVEESDDDIDATIPQFLRERRGKWEDHRQELGEAGLNLPPDYQDVDFSDDERLEELSEKPVLPHIKPPAPYKDVELRYSAGIVPAPIAQWLRDYQVKGAEFLHELYVFQKGGILGDDMGLGKTIQVIAFLTAAFGKTGDERDATRMRKMRNMADGRAYPKVLIICPGGLMANWKSELETWGWWQVDVFHGAPSVRDAVLSSARAGMLEIMITTYTTYRNHKDSINMVDWDCVIADECHQIKERTSEITKAMNGINALCRIGLTGTAIQNKYEELWTLLNWTNPGKFGPLATWKSSIAEPLKIGQSHEATNNQLSIARETARKLVHNLLPNFFLRRMKTLIADQLPKKTDKVVFCPLTEIQAQAYENLVNSELIDCIRRSGDPCECGSDKKRGWCCAKEVEGHGKWQNYVFPCLHSLQKLSNHLALLLPIGTDDKDKHERDKEALEIALPETWRDLYRQRDSIVNYANQDFCGKWKVLKKLLKFWHNNGDKVLVFSHSVRLLKMLQLLFQSTTSFNVSYLDGQMNYEDRAKEVADFNSNPTQFVFLISTKAGGVGLNITSANKVVVFDPNWNPSYDLQAQDRAYRIGQLRDVEVFRLVSAGTVEEIVYARQIYKQQQANIAYNATYERRYFRGVQDSKGKKGEIFGLANLFSFQGDNVVLRDIVNNTNIAETKAGVSVVGLQMDASQLEGGDEEEDALFAGADPDKADAVMKLLASAIEGGGDESLEKRMAAKKEVARKVNPIMEILRNAGVEYTHENSEVVGSSRIETKLSKKAEAIGGDIDVGNAPVFAKSQSQGRGGKFDEDLDEEDHDGMDVAADASRIPYRYRPPEYIRKRQFCSMARSMGYEDATDFALTVESWTQEERRNYLERFYRQRRLALAGNGE